MRTWLALMGVIVATLCVGPRAWAQSAPPLEAYGALPSLEMVDLSPSGNRIAFITVAGEQRVLAVFDRRTGTSLQSAGVGMVKVRNLQWIDDDRLFVTTSETVNLSSEQAARQELLQGTIFQPETGRTLRVLHGTPDLFPALMGSVSIIQTSGEPLILGRAYSTAQTRRLDLYRINPNNGRAQRHETMDQDIAGYILDDAGQTVARSSYGAASQAWGLQLRRGNQFQEVWSTTAPLDAPYLVGLGLNGDSVIVSADRPDLSPSSGGEPGYFDVNLATATWRPVRFDFEPDGLLFHPSTRRLVGAAQLEDEGMVYSFADDSADELWLAVESVLPDRRPQLVSWSSNLRSVVVFTAGDDDAGTYHLIDLDTRTHQEIGKAYRSIADSQVAPVEMVSYRATDGLEIHGYLTTPRGRDARNLPLVVLAHGGPAARDTRQFDWWAQALASRGYAVLQANFRGSTGYGDAFMEAGYGEWGRKMQTDLSDGVRWLAGRGVIDPQRVCIVGASYGGYAALAGPTLDRGVYRCAVSVAGVSDLRAMIANEANTGERRNNRTVRYWNRFMGADGPGDRSLDSRSPAYLADQADAPILLLHGRDDTVVPVEQSRTMVAALRRANKPHEYIELDGEDHWLSRSDTRTRMLGETVRFLELHNPPN